MEQKQKEKIKGGREILTDRRQVVLPGREENYLTSSALVICGNRRLSLEILEGFLWKRKRFSQEKRKKS